MNYCHGVRFYNIRLCFCQLMNLIYFKIFIYSFVNAILFLSKRAFRLSTKFESGDRYTAVIIALCLFSDFISN